jgi:hypothetical protein
VGFPVVFDDRWFQADLDRASPKGKDVAREARKQFEGDGIDPDLLMACQEDGPDGTRLPGCVKTYLGLGPGRGPGKWGMVFVGAQAADGSVELQFLAFGVRHQATGGRAPTVYWLADRRLHDKN